MNPAHMYHDGFARVTVLLATETGKSAKRSFWVVPLKRTEARVTFQVVNKDGSKWRTDKDGVEENAKEFIIVAPREILSERPAVLDLQYEELEVVTKAEFETWKAAHKGAQS